MRKAWLLVALLLIIPACFPTTAPAPESLPVIIAFKASPDQISSGDSSTLLWNVTGATTVQVDQGIGTVGLAGTQSISPATSTTYTLTASNSIGIVNQSVTISITSTPSPAPSPTPPPTPSPTPPPTPSPTPPPPPPMLPVVIKFDISPNLIDKSMGQKATLRWNVNHATHVVISPAFGSVPHQGSKLLSPSIGSHTYYLKATNAAGTVNRTQHLTVKP